MGFILRLFLGLAIAAIGVYFVFKTSSVVEFFGESGWAETKLGPGGSHLFYKLLGVVVILLGFIIAMNLWNAFIQATLGSFLGGRR